MTIYSKGFWEGQPFHRIGVIKGRVCHQRDKPVQISKILKRKSFRIATLSNCPQLKCHILIYLSLNSVLYLFPFPFPLVLHTGDNSTSWSVWLIVRLLPRWTCWRLFWTTPPSSPRTTMTTLLPCWRTLHSVWLSASSWSGDQLDFVMENIGWRKGRGVCFNSNNVQGGE